MSDDVRALRLKVKAMEEQLVAFKTSFVCALSELLDLKDLSTGVHSTRLAEWAVRVGEQLGLNEEELRDLEVASILHDVGKIGVPEAVLTKPGPLTEEEFTALRKHPEYGWAVLKTIPGLDRASQYVLHHHERIDGGGYPAGLAGDQIPRGARIVAVLDAFDAMISNRSYRRKMPVEVALQRLTAGAGTQFDADTVRQFASIAALEFTQVQAVGEPT